MESCRRSACRRPRGLTWGRQSFESPSLGPSERVLKNQRTCSSTPVTFGKHFHRSRAETRGEFIGVEGWASWSRAGAVRAGVRGV